jgi:ribosomal protein L11 methyltransferase
MAFGTGHHPTTAMIAEYLLENDITEKHLFDLGCGSGILGILALKLGAGRVAMADNDPVAVDNAIENVARNNAFAAEVYTGSIEIIEGKDPDIIIANINRPVLLEQMGSYFNALKPGGQIVISGIIDDDFPLLLEEAEKKGFKLKHKDGKNQWILLVFEKPEKNQGRL